MLLSIKVNTKPKERSLQNLKRPKTKFDTTYRRSQAIRIKLDFEKVLARVIKDHSIQPFRDFLSAIREERNQEFAEEIEDRLIAFQLGVSSGVVKNINGTLRDLLPHDRLKAAEGNLKQVRKGKSIGILWKAKQGLIGKIENEWPYTAANFDRVIWNSDAFAATFEMKSFEERLLQTMRQEFYVLRLLTSVRKTFLHDEQIRLESDFYPKAMKPKLQRLFANLERRLDKDEAQYKNKGSEFEVQIIFQERIGALTDKTVADKLKEVSNQMGVPFPLNYEPLTKRAKNQLKGFLEWKDQDIGESISFFEGRSENLNQQLEVLCPNDVPLVRKGLEPVYGMLLLAHRYVTTVLNLLYRMQCTGDSNNPIPQFPHRSVQKINLPNMRDQLKKIDRELEKALFEKAWSFRDPVPHHLISGDGTWGKGVIRGL
ncbi:MAG: hypothetical protein MRJ96_06930 [Nitrospirales bacterium]|nr:hypothetical protein [Nitrospirales bacterium]